MAIPEASDSMETFVKKIEGFKRQEPHDKEELRLSHTLLNKLIHYILEYSKDSKIFKYEINPAHLSKMFEAAKCDLPHLFIFESKSTIGIYVNVKKFFIVDVRNFISRVKDLTDQEEIKEKIMELLQNLEGNYQYKHSINVGTGNKLLECLKGTDENEVKNQGGQLQDVLIPPELKTKLKSDIDEIKEVWIFCDEGDIDYHWEWEWIHWKDDSKKEDFFWGDKFHIVRIPSACDFKDSTFPINAFTILIDDPCQPARSLHKISHKYLRELLENIVKCEEKIVCTYKELSELKISNCVHLGGYKETFEEQHYLETILDILSRNKPKFLFLNTFGENPSGTQCSLSKKIYKNMDAHTTWVGVDCSLNVPVEFALVFEECFYEVLKNSLQNDNKEAKITEIIAKTREKIEEIKNQGDLGCSTFWKLAYVVNGNPYNKLIFA